MTYSGEKPRERGTPNEEGRRKLGFGWKNFTTEVTELLRTLRKRVAGLKRKRAYAEGAKDAQGRGAEEDGFCVEETNQTEFMPLRG